MPRYLIQAPIELEGEHYRSHRYTGTVNYRLPVEDAQVADDAREMSAVAAEPSPFSTQHELSAKSLKQI